MVIHQQPKESAKFSFEDLEQKINRYRAIMGAAIKEEQAKARLDGDDPGSVDVQDRIYEKFRENVTDEELETFKSNFYALTLQRDEILKRYVDKSVAEIKSKAQNAELLPAHFVVVHARDKITNAVDRNIVQVTDYFNEKNINKVIKEKPREYIPLNFKRREGQTVEFKDIEILSVSNLTGLYDVLDSKDGKVAVDDLKYSLYSRIKMSDREMIKFVDWVLGLRSEEDYPYDAIGLISVVPNENLEGKLGGEQIYSFGTFVEKFAKKYGPYFVKNVNNKEQNAKMENKKPVVQKLNAESYDPINYATIIRNCKHMIDRVKKKMSNKDYLPNKEERETLLQGKQYKHYVESTRAETWVMNKFMYEIYIGEIIGHTTKYISRREQERIAYLNNPALSDAYQDELKRRKKNCVKTEVDCPPQPSRTRIAERVQNLFYPVFNN
jgi:hypothetical protein